MNRDGGHGDLDQVIFDGLRTLRNAKLPPTKRKEVSEAMRLEGDPPSSPSKSFRAWQWWLATGGVAMAVLVSLLLGGRSHSNAPNPAAHATAVSSVGSAVADPSFFSISMESDTTGWATIGPQSRHGPGIVAAIVHTTDQGRTWANVTPNRVSLRAQISLVSASPNTAFLVVSTNKTYVYVTHDGGKSWSYGSPIPTTFRNARASVASVGSLIWVDLGDGANNHSTPAQLFVSFNDGLTWKLLATASEYKQRSGFPGFGWIEFLSPSVGYTSTGGLNNLWRTTDGGTSWTEASVGACCDIQITAPEFVGSTGLASAYQLGQLVPTVRLLTTTDGGKTWTAAIKALPGTGSVGVDVVSDHVAVVASTLTDDIYVTTNAGRTWRVVHAPARIAAKYELDVLDFISARTGWAEMSWRSEPYGQESLFFTTDGGATWTQVAP